MSDIALYILAIVITCLELLTAAIVVRTPSQAKILSACTVSLTSFFATMLLFSSLSVWIVILFSLTLIRIVSISRLAVQRTTHKELQTRAIRSSAVFSLLTALIMIIDSLEIDVPWLSISVGVSVIGSVMLCVSAILTIRKYSANHRDKTEVTRLPTVSVCIPARNETQDLPECIETVLSSTYPKLEVLVLDDCSHDKTPEVIKEYAHRGVRFLSGQEPKDGWLAKNKAMDKLFEESSGEIVIFSGVDVRYSPDTVQQIVSQMDTNTRMISVLPRRREANELSVFIQPLRYWWEVAVPRFFIKRPPVLSTTWAIYRKDLQKIGEFDSVKSSVQPEAHFAKRLSKAYTFIIAGARLGLTSVKSPKEQYDTAIRTRYPQVKRRPESVAILLGVEIILFFTPIIGIINSSVDENVVLFVLSVVSMTLLIITNTIISALAVRRTWLLGVFTLPFLLLEEWYVLIRSLFAYEFGTVIWKERNICLPMLKVEKSLPAIDK